MAPPMRWRSVRAQRSVGGCARRAIAASKMGAIGMPTCCGSAEIRHSPRYVPTLEREQVARDLKPIYTAVRCERRPSRALKRFDEQWGTRSR